jgi:FtsH-binding integral membrane protein
VSHASGEGGARPRFDRHLVLDQLGGWRGMVDASLPTVAFIVANGVGGLWPGIWAALACALLVFVLRLVRRQSIQQAVSGLFAVGVAVAIAAVSGHARDFFVLGILRNAAIAVVLVGSTLVRWPLVGVIAEFLAPSHLGDMAGHRLPGLLRRDGAVEDTAEEAVEDTAEQEPDRPARRPGEPDPQPELHWRDDRRVRRAYTWLTLMWAATFLARVVVQGPLYQRNEVGLLGTSSLVLGLPVTAVALVVSLWVVARLHRHRTADGDERV